jgi:hypothetical protein
VFIRVHPWCLFLFISNGDVRGADAFTPTNSPRPDFWDTDGVINAVVATNGVVYVGGDFSYVAPKGTKLAAIDTYTGERLTEFPAILGTQIRAVVEDGNGGWFIGGKFAQVGGLPRTNLVHVLSDHRVDPNFAPDPDSAVHALALDGNTLFVGGDFTSIGGQARSRIAALDTATGTPSGWRPEAANGLVAVLLVDGNRVFAGGYFSGIGGRPQEYLAALDIVSGAATSWSPQCDGAVLALGLRNELLYVGGNFNLIGGAERNGLAALDLMTALAARWNPNPGPIGHKVAALRIVCDTVYVGGHFTHMGGLPRHRVAAVHADSGLATDWNANLGLTLPCRGESSISSLEVFGNTVYMAGEFASAGNETRRDVAAVDLTSGQVLPWNPDLNGGASAIAVGGRTVLVGLTATPGGVERCNLAAFDAVTGRVTDWAPGADGVVHALAVAGGQVFVGGSFTNIGGLPRSRIAALDAVGGAAVPGWTNHANGDVLALSASGGSLFLGGRFTQMGGSTRRRLAALDRGTGALLSNWVAHVNSGNLVGALASADGALYVGGSFDSIGASNRNHLAALEVATGAVLPWNPGADGRVRALAVAGGVVYAGGEFDQVGSVSREGLAAIDALTGQITDWNPAADSSVYALAVSGDTIYAGGNFLALGGAERLGAAAVGADGQLMDWNPGTSRDNRVLALAFSENALHVAGSSGLGFNGSADFHVMGVFPQAGAPVVTQTPRDQRVPLGQSAEFSVMATGPVPLSYQWRFNGVDLFGETNATLSLVAVQLAQSGRYQVVVTNAFGAVTAEATLTVLQAPSIIVQPMGQVVATGETATLSVVAAGSPPSRYQWRLNGANIPGAVFPELTLSNMTPASGGTYQLVAFNGVGAVSSDLATILVPSAPLPFSHQFSATGATIAGAMGLGSGNNAGATNEINEPRHAGKVGGSSVWLRWIAPANGVATFDTRGSGFDTLLAVYTGTDFSSLAELASDEDRGGFLTSRASFNAVAGTEYRIAVDGLGGATGNIVLSWELDTDTVEFPRITTHPLTQSVTNGETAVFTVAVAFSATPLRYQWFFGCHEIRGATNDTLTISNAQSRQVGHYRVMVMNASDHVTESRPAALEIGLLPTAFSHDKPEDSLTGADFGGAFRAAASQSFLLSWGSLQHQFNTKGYTTTLCETNLCGVPGGASAWFRFQAEQSGVLHIDTMGSSFDTVLGLYGPPFPISCPAQNLLACDNNSASDGVRSLIRFPAVVAGRTYLAVVDGAGGASGLAVIRWQLGLPPVVVTNGGDGSSMTVQRGSNLTLRVSVANPVPPPGFQWLLNGQVVSGATNSNLELTNVQGADSGTYSVIVSNFAGAVTYTSASVTVDVPLHVQRLKRGTNGQASCVVMGNPGQNYVLQASTNLMDWTGLMTNVVSAKYWDECVDANAFQHPRRFYRAVPWVPFHLRSQIIRTNGSWQVRLLADAFGSSVLEATEDLVHWQPLHTNATPGLPLDFLDRQASNHSWRFYRARPWP